MSKSITETLKKINIELKGSTFLSIILTLILMSLFISYKIFNFKNKSIANTFNYQKANISKENSDQEHFIYASSRGKKYYFYNCKSSIKEENRIFFNNEESAKKAGYTLAKTCK